MEWIKKLFVQWSMKRQTKKLNKQIKEKKNDSSISYFSKRIIELQIQLQNEREKYLKKIYKYRNVIIENGLNLPED